MKVVLINPPYGELSYKPRKVPPFSLAFIAKSLHNHKINYKFFDFGYETVEYSKKIIKNNNAQFFGVSFSQENCQIAFELIKFIKKKHSNSKIIIGGIFPTLAHKDILSEFNEIDFIVRGEGEKAIIDIINDNFRGDKGISFRKKGNLFFSKKINRIKNFDRFSPPIYKNEIIKEYNMILRESEMNINVIPIIWSRGCNHNCSFCTINPTNLWRCRSNRSVLLEIKGKYNQKTQSISIKNNKRIRNQGLSRVSKQGA